MFVEGAFYGALRFVNVFAIVEFAFLANGKNFWEEMTEVRVLHVDQSEALNPWCINNITAHLQRVHLSKSGGVLSLIVAAAHGARS